MISRRAAVFATLGFWLDLFRRGVRRSPKTIALRLLAEIRAEAERFRASARARGFDERTLLRAASAGSIDELWRRLAERPYLAALGTDSSQFDRLCPGDRERILEAARHATSHQVDLLGSGIVDVGSPIDWHRDFKSGVSWPPGYSRRISYLNPLDTSDVKFPWELSRLQWLIPVSQAYALTKREEFARTVRDVLDDWMRSNPYAYSVNWSVTMEAALRLFTWTWFFHVFQSSPEWSDPPFRRRLLSAIYLHADYVERNLERSDVNGNHFTANAAGLVVAGLFFGAGRGPERWASSGWEMLQTEIETQVHPDGADFEGSTAYHRLVTELFAFPALYRARLGQPTPPAYRDRLHAMALFIAAYTRPDGSSPNWGDADDGRVLPFGTQQISDHRYLLGVIGSAWGLTDLCDLSYGPVGEAFWLLGGSEAVPLVRSRPKRMAASAAFLDAGVYVMRDETDHVFIDAGPVGTSGRGGHGHNDCLSLELMLDGTLLIADPGSYVYTASYEWRNRFRSTSFHNTPVLDEEEQNRFLGSRYLWSLRNDAKPTVHEWKTDERFDRVRASHSGYQRLGSPVTPTRTICLDRTLHRLLVRDVFSGIGHHRVHVGFQLARNVHATLEDTLIRLETADGFFLLRWTPTGAWSVSIEQGWMSPSYGVRFMAPRVVFSRNDTLAELTVTVARRGDRGDEQSFPLTVGS